jgi:hypothetical protein
MLGIILALTVGTKKKKKKAMDERVAQAATCKPV